MIETKVPLTLVGTVFDHAAIDDVHCSASGHTSERLLRFITLYSKLGSSRLWLLVRSLIPWHLA